jgi:flagellin
MNVSMERMASGSKINSAADDAAGFAVSITLKTNISGTAVAADNVAIGQDLLNTTEGILAVVTTNLQRVRDLMEQASNGTYTDDDRAAVQAEVTARLDQITSITNNATFNGKTLFSASAEAVVIQSGTTAAEQTSLAGSIFDEIDVSTLSTDIDAAFTTNTTSALSAMLADIDTQLTDVTTRQTDIGAVQNQLDAVSSALAVQGLNMQSTLSTVQDADVASESAAYVQAQILQSASATLLVQANSAPQIALTLIQG